MMFYKGRRIYYRLEDARNKFGVLKPVEFVANVDKGSNRFFLTFSSSDEFKRWYSKLHQKEKTINEVVLSDKRKLIIDIDNPENDGLAQKLFMYDFKKHVPSRIREVFTMLEIGIPEVIMYDMCDPSESKISYHAVVSNFLFSAETCKGICMIISLGQIWDKCVDFGVYKSVQCVRIEDSTKFGEARWKQRNNMKHLPFESGLISDKKRATESDIVCRAQRPIPLKEQQFDLRFIDMSQFRIGKQKNNFLPLHRIKPGYCTLCNRVHEKENAGIRYVLGKQIYMCWRKVNTRY